MGYTHDPVLDLLHFPTSRYPTWRTPLFSLIPTQHQRMQHRYISRGSNSLFVHAQRQAAGNPMSPQWVINYKCGYTFQIYMVVVVAIDQKTPHAKIVTGSSLGRASREQSIVAYVSYAHVRSITRVSRRVDGDNYECPLRISVLFCTVHFT